MKDPNKGWILGNINRQILFINHSQGAWVVFDENVDFYQVKEKLDDLSVMDDYIESDFNDKNNYDTLFLRESFSNNGFTILFIDNYNYKPSDYHDIVLFKNPITEYSDILFITPKEISEYEITILLQKHLLPVSPKVFAEKWNKYIKEIRPKT